MFEEIGKMEDYQNRMDSLSKVFLVLATPKLTDMRLIPNIYHWFCESKKIHKEELSVMLRDQFLFIVLYLYSPEKLTNKNRKMKKNLRVIMNKTLELTAKSLLSNQCDKLYANYKTYKSFREDINDSYLYIKEKLESSGLASGL